tara:strand:- start:3344 stop:3463 length:120 start_codon:yes stop_codon:yes gene_type:complete
VIEYLFAGALLFIVLTFIFAQIEPLSESVLYFEEEDEEE